MHLKSQILEAIPSILHGFGTADEPVPQLFPEDWLTHWEKFRPRMHQVHGTIVSEVRSPAQQCGEGDGLYTGIKNIPIGIMTADCVPVLLAHVSGKKVAAVHAGWRGTRAHILSHLWRQMALQGERSQEWVAAIGPAIGPCCYEVSEDLASDFEMEFSELGSHVAVPRSRHLDLPLINATELRRIGFKDVDLLRVCTRCSAQPTFHSYRREGAGTRQWSVILRST